MKSPRFLLLATSALAVAILAQGKHLQHPYSASDEGFGRVHMDISGPLAVAAEFDRALALLHNFWYVRALERFNQGLNNDPGCAMAYWGAAMTYKPSVLGPSDASRRNGGVDSRAERVVNARGFCTRENYLAAVAALYKEAGAGSKSARDQNYRDAMAVAYAQYPDDETTLFYGLSILGAIPEGSHGGD